MKVLITDPFLRKTFDIANILKSNNYELIIGFDGNIFQKLLLKLLYSSEIVKLNTQNFNLDLQNIENNISEDIVFFTIEESSIIQFYKYKENNNTSIKYLLPSDENFQMVRNKKLFSQFCLNNNINVPKEFTFDEINQFDELPTNIILKPSIGSGSVGIKFANSKEEFNNLNIQNKDEYLIQDRIDNGKDILGGFFLFDQGKFISYYGHQRIRTYPEEGGVTVYSKVDYNEEIKSLGIELLSTLNWSGLAMIEFLYDSNSNSYKIIELNPRAWGSIMLSEYSNSNMISNYVNLALRKEPKILSLKKNVFIRWFFPWDFISYIKKKGNIKNFWKLNTNNTCYINFSYGNFLNTTLFLFINIFDPNKIRKLYKKVFRK